MVVGGGLSGLAAAGAVHEAGLPVVVRDRGRAPGGRLGLRSVRGTGTRWDGRPVDVGAAFLTVRHPVFEARVTDWERRGLLTPWTDTLAVAGPEGITGETGGVMRWSAPAGLRSLAADLAAALPAGTVQSEHIVREVELGEAVRVDGEPAALALVCTPDPQALRLLPDSAVELRHTLGSVPWEPVLALTAVYERREWPPITGVFVNGSRELSFIADDGSRRGDGAPVLVLHSGPALAAAHLDQPANAIPAMLAALRDVLGVAAQPLVADMHRWTLARPAFAREELHFIDGKLGIGVAGDAWHGGPRIEAAWLSGRTLGQAAVRVVTAR